MVADVIEIVLTERLLEESRVRPPPIPLRARFSGTRIRSSRG
jgi:hypothetical protein